MPTSAPPIAPPIECGSRDPLSDCLIARYPFEGDFRDQGPNHLDGTLYGTSTFGPGPCGEAGSAYVLKGGDSYVSLGASALLKPDRVVTVGVWMQVMTLAPTYQNIISDHGRDETKVGYAFTLRLAASDLQFLLGGVYGLGTATYAHLRLSSEDIGVWHHVVGVYDGSSIRLYVDGVLKSSVPFNQSMKQNANPMLVGKSGYGEPFNGSMDDLRIYRYALDESTIANLYSSRRCPTWAL